MTNLWSTTAGAIPLRQFLFSFELSLPEWFPADKLLLPKNSLFQSSKLMVSALVAAVVGANIVIVWCFDGKRYALGIIDGSFFMSMSYIPSLIWYIYPASV